MGHPVAFKVGDFWVAILNLKFPPIPESGFWREFKIQNRNSKIANFKRDYLDNDNDSKFTVKTKNAQFFMIFPNISFFHMIVTEWPGPLRKNHLKNNHSVKK
jgi:hypothetical protein